MGYALMAAETSLTSHQIVPSTPKFERQALSAKPKADCHQSGAVEFLDFTPVIAIHQQPITPLFARLLCNKSDGITIACGRTG